MASTYSPNLRIELIGSGEQANTWGNTTNTNLGTLIEQAICGLVTVDVTAANVTLTNLNGASDQARNMILAITGSPGVSRTVTAPAVSKAYIVSNASNAAVTLLPSGGTGISIPAGTKMFVYTDGSTMFQADTSFNSVAILGGSITGTTINNSAIGGSTPSTGAFTTLSASSTVSGTGFSTYLASPPAIGGTAAAAGAFTTLSASSTVSGTGFSTYLASPPAIGGTTAAAITGTTITANTGFAGPHNGTVGATTPNTGAFTTLSASSTVSGTGFSTYLASPPAIGGTAAAAVTGTIVKATTNFTFPDNTTQTTAATAEFVSGTALLFYQAAAPTGWTKSTTNNDKALRVVSGTSGGSAGGSVAFSTAFASQTPSGSVSTSISAISGSVGTSISAIAGSVGVSLSAGGSIANATAGGSVAVSASGSVGATTLAESQIPSHTHSYNILTNLNAYTSGGAPKPFTPTASTTGATGGGGSHTHGFTDPTYSFTGTAHTHTLTNPTYTGSFTFSSGTASSSFTFSSGTASSSFTGNAINLAVQYCDVIICTKN